MSLTQEQIAKLSLNLSKVRLDRWKLWDKIDNIFKYMTMLDEVDTTWVEPTISVIDKESILREDTLLEERLNPSELLACTEQKVVWWQITVSNIMK